MASDKRARFYGPDAFGANWKVDIDAKTTGITNRETNILRWDRAHAATLFFELDNENDDAGAGDFAVEFDLYDEDGSTIIFSGSLVTAVPSFPDNKLAFLFGGGVVAAQSDGTIDADAELLQIFNRIRFRVNVTVANTDTGTAVIRPLGALVQE